MSVIVMQVVEETAHPNADALRVYQFRGREGARVQVVANLSNMYRVGDLVAVAQVGAELRDGTKIKPARLRGVDSFGMALGLHEAPLGSDVSSLFCAPVPEQVSEAHVITWPSIELLHNVRAGLLTLSELQQRPLPRVRYRAKVKLDGTNAGVQVWSDGRVVAQSRTQVLSATSDNMGFFAWTNKHREYFSALKDAGTFVIFGEWCGAGIQKRAAISKIDRKIFVVFAIQYGDHNREAARVVTDPSSLRALLPHHPDIFVLPWIAEEFELDFADDSQLKAEAARISDVVHDIEDSDPWVNATFGIHGLGEGIVLYPMLSSATAHDRMELAELMFKAKGEKHQVVRQKSPAQLEPEVAKSIAEFVELVTTEARLEQGLQTVCQGKVQVELMGAFLKWIAQDVQKECLAELTASGLTWPQVQKAISTKARQWFTALARQ